MIAQEEATITRRAAAAPVKENSRSRRLLAPTDVVTAIDVGTTKVCTIVGRKAGANGIRVLGYSTVPCDGLRKGNVSDVPATAAAIKESVLRAEVASGYRIESAFVGVTGSHVSFENRRDKLGSGVHHGVITADQLARTPSPDFERMDEPGRRMIHAIRRSYSLDGVDGIRNPVGMHSRRIEVDTHLVTGGATFLVKLAKAVEDAGIAITSLVLEPLASGLAVMTAQERDRGSVLVDIGGGTTDVVGFTKGRVCYTGVIPVGGFQFTNDIAVTFNTPYDAAEDVKLRYASVEGQPAGKNVEITLPVTGGRGDLRVRSGDISQLARERAHELARLVKLKLDESEIDDSVKSRIVLTGGTSNLPGLTELMRRVLSIPVRQGVPEVRGALPEELKDPIYATGVGILLWGLNDYVSPTVKVDASKSKGIEAGGGNFLSGLYKGLGRLMRGALFSSKKRRS